MSFDLLTSPDGEPLLFCNPDGFDALQALVPPAGDRPGHLILRLPGGRRHQVALPPSARAGLEGQTSLVAAVIAQDGTVTQAQRLPLGPRQARGTRLEPADVAGQLVAAAKGAYTVTLIR